jgi:hypothetical protein
MFAVTLKVVRRLGSYGEVGAHFYTSDVSADGLFTHARGEIAFSDGQTELNLKVDLHPNMKVDSDDKSFRVVLHSPTNGAVLGKPQSSSVTDFSFFKGGIETYAYATVKIYDLSTTPDITTSTLNVNSQNGSPLTL